MLSVTQRGHLSGTPPLAGFSSIHTRSTEPSSKRSLAQPLSTMTQYVVSPPMFLGVGRVIGTGFAAAGNERTIKLRRDALCRHSATLSSIVRPVGSRGINSLHLLDRLLGYLSHIPDAAPVRPVVPQYAVFFVAGGQIERPLCLTHNGI